jgi:hypothetical protein
VIGVIGDSWGIEYYLTKRRVGLFDGFAIEPEKVPLRLRQLIGYNLDKRSNGNGHHRSPAEGERVWVRVGDLMVQHEVSLDGEWSRVIGVRWVEEMAT